MMMLIATTIVPIALLIALGYWLRTSGFLADAFWPAAERLSYYVLLPALFIYGLATAQLDGLPVYELVSVLLISTLIGAIVLVLCKRMLIEDGPSFTSMFQGAIRFNNYIGVTIAAALFGSSGIALAAVANAAIVPTVNILCVLVFARFGTARSSWRGVLRSIVLNPLVVACGIGTLLHISGLGLPAGIEQTMKALGHAALPLGLMCVGAALGFGALKTAVKPMVIASTFKLILLPLLTLVLCLLTGLTGKAASIAVLFQALPTASSSYVMARQMGGNAPLMATIIAAQTLLAILALPLILRLINGL